MGIFTTLSTAGSGLTAQRMRLDVISDNIANADTTRTVDGGPFRRSRVILQAWITVWEKAWKWWKSRKIPTVRHGWFTIRTIRMRIKPDRKPVTSNIRTSTLYKRWSI